MNIEVKIFSELNNELKQYWKNLEKNSFFYCFQSLEWFENWLNNFSTKNKKNTYFIAVVFIDSKTACIFPFEVKKKLNVKILTWAGGEQSDYFSPVISSEFKLDKEKFHLIWKKVVGLMPKVDLIYLNKQPRLIETINNPFVSFLKNHKESKLYNVLLPETWEEYTKKILKKNFLAQNLRKEKYLKKLGNLEFKIANNEKESIEFINELILQKNKRLSSKGIKNVFKKEDLNFYKEFIQKKTYTIQTQVSALLLDGEIIATHWGVILKKRFYYLVLSMKEGAFERYSPGRLLIANLINWSISNNFKIFDFTVGDESYKKSWSNNFDFLFAYFKPMSIKGLILYIIIKLKFFLKLIDKNGFLSKVFSFIKRNNI